MAVAKRLHLRAFLEGIEVPVIAASVNIYTNSPAAASVQILPLDSGMDLMPRTMIHVFFWNPKAQDYCLFFTGEVVGFAFQQTPQSRALMLQCLDFSNYWDCAHVTALEYGVGGNAFTHTGVVWASNVRLIDDIVSHQQEKLVSWLKETPKTPGLQTVSGLAGGIIRILEAIGGVPGYEKGINDFFTIAQLRCRILEQVTAEENDDTALKLLSAKVFDEWLRNGLQNMGQQITFRDMIKLLSQYIYYEMVPNPLAKFDAAEKGESKRGEAKFYTLKQIPTGKSVYAKLDELLARTTMLIANKGPAPLQGPMAVHALVLELGGAKANLDTIAKYQPTLSSDIATVKAAVDHALDAAQSLEAREAIDSWGQFKPIQDAIRDARDSFDKVTSQVEDPGLVTSQAKTQRLHAQFFRPDCWFGVPPTCNVIFPEQFTQVVWERNFLSEVTRSLVQVFPTLVGPDRLLANRILSPAITDATRELSAAVDQNSYRMLMEHEYHTGIIPREEWLPDTAAVNKDASAIDKTNTKGARITWAQRVAQFHFFQYRFASRQVQVGGRFNPNVVCGFPAAVLRAPFMPDMREVAAQSGITDPQDLDTKILEYIGSHSVELNGPSHLLGMVGSVTHSLDQQGGTTNVAIHHVRRHVGTDDEFLRISQRVTLDNVEQVVKVILRYDDLTDKPERLKVLAELTPKLSDTDISFAQAVTKRDIVLVNVDQTYAEVNPDAGKVEETPTTFTVPVSRNAERSADAPPPLTMFASFDGGTRKGLAPSAPVRRTVGDAGILPGSKIVAIEVLANGATQDDPSYGLCFREVVVHERVTLALTGEVPVEEILRPRGWFSPKFANTAIGSQIYQPFFGCDSIIDEFQRMMGKTVSTAIPVDEEPRWDAQQDDATSFVAKVAANESTRLTLTAERALNVLSYIYGLVKSQRLDTDDFIESYNARPIATLRQMLGDEDVRFEITDSKVKLAKGYENKVIGFHTMAVNEDVVKAGKLAGLVEDPSTGLPRINNTGESSPILAAYDVRQEKREMVTDYVEDLQRGPGFIG